MSQKTTTILTTYKRLWRHLSNALENNVENTRPAGPGFRPAGRAGAEPAIGLGFLRVLKGRNFRPKLLVKLIAAWLYYTQSHSYSRVKQSLCYSGIN